MIMGDRGGKHHRLIDWMVLLIILLGIDDGGVPLQYLVAEPLILVFSG